MTNQSETTDSPENDGGGGGIGSHKDRGGPAGADTGTGAVDGGHCLPPQVTLSTPAELADALPYLLGHRPEDSIVLVALHEGGGQGRFGGRARLGIPADAGDWAAAARQLAQTLVRGSERRGTFPEGMIVYVCQEPARDKDDSGRQVMERLRPLAQLLRTECGKLDVPVVEALCLSDGRYWSYCCPGEECCPPEGVPMGLPGTSVLAAAAVYAGLQVRGLRELRTRLLPWEGEAAVAQEVTLDAAGVTVIPRMLGEQSRADVAVETVELAGRVMTRFAAAPCAGDPSTADARDDELLTDDEAAVLIFGLQDRTTRDRAAEWMEGDDVGPALRLWRALARRCVGPYGEHAAAPLTLVGWVAWSSGDELEAREALALALGADPTYLFARLLHQACNEGLDPESVRRCLRGERARRNPGGEARGEPGTRTGTAADTDVGKGAGKGLDKGVDPGAYTGADPGPETNAAALQESGRSQCLPSSGRAGTTERRATRATRTRPRSPEAGSGRPPATARRIRPGTTARGRFRTWGSGAEGDG
jgi:Domain of unknown function (DUF4192)